MGIHQDVSTLRNMDDPRVRAIDTTVVLHLGDHVTGFDVSRVPDELFILEIKPLISILWYVRVCCVDWRFEC